MNQDAYVIKFSAAALLWVPRLQMLGFGLLTAIMIRPVLAYALIFGPSAFSTVSMLLFAAYIATVCKDLLVNQTASH